MSSELASTELNEHSEEERAKRRVAVDLDIEVPPARVRAGAEAAAGGSSPQAALKFTRLDSEDEYASIRSNFKTLDPSSNPIFATIALSLVLDEDGTVDMFKAGDVLGVLKVSIAALTSRIERELGNWILKEFVTTKPTRSGSFYIMFAFISTKRASDGFSNVEAEFDHILDVEMLPVQNFLLSIQLLVGCGSIFGNNASFLDIGLDLHAR